MTNLKDEFIKAIMQSLNIDKNPFIYATIDEYISHINPTEYKEFMKRLFGNHHQYLNGMDRISKVAEEFSTLVQEDEHDKDAKRLISLVQSISDKVFEDSQSYKIQFSDLIKKLKLTAMIDNQDLAVLNAVKPYCDAKNLISNINSYQDAKIQLNAFIKALKYNPKETKHLENAINRLRINR